MGAGQSTASQAPPRGLHVLRVTPSSPASETTIEPFFDFVVGFKGDSLTSNKAINAVALEKIVESHEGKSLDLLVWNSKSQTTRVVPIVPSRDWALPQSTVPDPQEPEAERKPSLLGLSMRMCEPETSLDNVWHVLDVLEGSPAESAGLVPYGDWIIGWSGGVLSAEGDFYDIVESHIEKPLRVYVYSYDFDNIREVVLVPNRHWGGEGLLGCVFGFGLLHRIPALPENRDPDAIPPELLPMPDEYEEQQLFVPADLAGDVHETPEESEERMRWEQEEWERESYARTYAHDAAAANPTSSAYDDPSEFEHDFLAAESHGQEEDRQNRDTQQVAPVKAGYPEVVTQTPIQPVAPTPLRPHVRQFSGDSQGTPIASTRSSSFSIPRGSTPTPARPLGSYMNGVGISPRTPSWDTRGSAFDFGASRDVEGTSRAHVMNSGGHGEDEDDLDGTSSVADTEFTDVSEATSQGSLTSVD